MLEISLSSHFYHTFADMAVPINLQIIFFNRDKFKG